MRNLLFTVVLILSVNVYGQEYINIRTIDYEKINGKAETSIYESKFNKEYLDIDLVIMPKGNFKASKEVIKLTTKNPNKSKVIVIIDDKNEVIFFNGSTDFLNYMSDHSYSMTTKLESKYRTEYTFKRKK